MQETSLPYQLDGLDPAILESEIDRLWRLFQTDPEMQAELQATGVTPDQLSGHRRDVIRVEQKGKGFDAFTQQIILTVIGVAAETALTKVIIPWIRKLHGSRSIHPPSKSQGQG